MARKFPDGLAKSRFDGFMFDPMSNSLVIDEKYNVGRWRPTTSDQVRALAELIVSHAESVEFREHGQLQPVEVRKISVDEYAVVLGFTRAKAFRLINTDEDFRKRLGLKTDEVYPIKAIMTNKNEEDAILDCIAENMDRVEISPMDRANAVSVLSSKGWSDKKIADRFNMNVNWVGQLKKLFLLEPQYQEMVHSGTMPVDAALHLTDIKPEERPEVVQEAVRPNGKVNGQALKSAKRERVLQKAEETGTEVAVTVSRSLKELRNFFQAQADPENDNYDVVQTFFKRLLDYTQGKCGDKAVLNAINACVESEIVEESEIEEDVEQLAETA